MRSAHGFVLYVHVKGLKWVRVFELCTKRWNSQEELFTNTAIIVILFPLIFSLFIASLIQPKAWSVYLGSVVIGYGASGNFLCFYFNVAKTSWRYNINCQHYWFIWGGLLYWGMIGTLFFTNFCTYRIWWFHVLENKGECEN